ncbi:hypothetical protein [Roseateles sp. BYS96W]|uniref:Uncharacterized protein n=1 Tax=Pelomonas nitida TaxID=3299027 RepID=A0ABW7G4K2_9BURK
MLHRLETLLETPLATALGSAATLVLAAGDKPPDTQKPQLALLATRLTRAPAAPDSDAAGREPAYASTMLTLTASAADPRLFALPPGAASRVAEVQSPPGRLLPQADAWVADAAGLHLLQAPTAPVRALLRGTAVKGYQERWAARIDLGLVAWAQQPDTASDLLGQALAVVLGQLFELDLVDLQEAPPDGGLSLRLLKPSARLLQVDRGLAAAGNVSWHRAAAQLQIDGELVQCLTMGVADPASTIKRIDFELGRLRADGTLGQDTGSVGG